MKINTFKILGVLIYLLVLSCHNNKKIKTADSEPYFEGKLTLSETQGIYGKLLEKHTTFWISENAVRREQKIGGVNSIFNLHAGIIVDLKKDTVVMYYSDKISGIQKKHTLSLGEFKSKIQRDSLPTYSPSVVDRTFKFLDMYRATKQIKDSTSVKGFKSDYTLYKDSHNMFKQEILDTKEIKMKRELLEIVFPNIPKEINFPLTSDIRTTISDISNDTIISGEKTRAIYQIIGNIIEKNITTSKNTKISLEKISKNKWLKLGLNLIKKGVDLDIHIKSEISEFTEQKPTKNELLHLAAGFEEIADMDDFIRFLPSGESIDWDD